jgi:hypothetical protein
VKIVGDDSRKRGHEGEIFQPTVASKIQRREKVKIDRSNVVPTLLKVYVRQDDSVRYIVAMLSSINVLIREDDFNSGKQPEKTQEFYFHVW